MANVARDIAILGGRIAGLFETDGGSGVSEARFALTLEDRDLEDTHDDLVNTLHQAFDAANKFGQYVSISGPRDPKELEQILSGLSSSLGERGNPFITDMVREMSEGKTSDLLARFGSHVEEGLLKTGAFNRATVKGGRHKLMANRLLQQFKSNIGNLVSFSKTDKGIDSPSGDPQRSVELQTTLSSLVPSNESTGPAGKLRERGVTKTQGIIETISDGNGGTKEIIVGNLNESAKALLRIHFLPQVKAGIFAEAASGTSNVFSDLVKLHNLDKELELTQRILQGAIDAKDNPQENLGVFTRAMAGLEQNIADSSTVAKIKQMASDITNNRSDGSDELAEAQRKTVDGYTKQITIKQQKLTETSQDLINLVDFWNKHGGSSRGSVPLPQVNPDMQRFLKQLPEGMFEDGILSKTEIEGFISQLSQTIKTFAGRENLSYSGMFQYVFGKSALEDNRFKEFLKYNTSVNGSFVSFAESILKEIQEGTAQPDAKTRLEEEVLSLRLRDEKNRLQVNIDLYENHPLLVRRAAQDKLITASSKAELWKSLFRSTYRSNQRQGDDEPATEAVKSLRFNELLPAAFQSIRTKGDVDFINSGNDLLRDDFIQRYGAKINALFRSSQSPDPKIAGEAKKALRAMRFDVGENLIAAYGFNKDSYDANREVLKTILANLNKKAEKAAVEGKKLSTRDESTRRMILTVDQLFGDKDIFGVWMEKLGFPRKQIEGSRRISNQINRAQK